jgi:hypothetical protein
MVFGWRGDFLEVLSADYADYKSDFRIKNSPQRHEEHKIRINFAALLASVRTHITIFDMRRHPGESRDPSIGSRARGEMGPDLRRDDDRWGKSFP